MDIKGFLLKAGWIPLISLLLPADSGAGQAYSVAVRKISGTGGEAATAILTNALKASNQIRLVPEPRGAFRAEGNLDSETLHAEFIGPDGKTLFKQKYGPGDLIQDVRQFADDIVLALTRKPGIATSQIAFVRSVRGTPQIHLCDFDGGNIRQITRSGINQAPALSPDGRQLAYVTRSKGSLESLVVLDLESKKLKQISHEPAREIRPVFSPDGKTLGVTMAHNSETPDMFLVKLTGGRRVKPILETPVAEMSPSFSPGGDRVVFCGAPAPGESRVFILPIKSQGKPQAVPTGPLPAIEPAWSPDGAQIAFAAIESSQSWICVHDLQSNRVRRIARGRSPAWGANSRHLVYTAPRGLFIADSESGGSSLLVANALDGMGVSWTR